MDIQNGFLVIFIKAMVLCVFTIL